MRIRKNQMKLSPKPTLSVCLAVVSTFVGWADASPGEIPAVTNLKATDRGGRPFNLLDEGRPLTELFG